MKKISVLIPCYNEEENVVPMSEAVADIFAKVGASKDRIARTHLVHDKDIAIL